jgi:hypothetical protein
MFKLYFLTSVADLVASVTLNYQLIQNFYLKIKTRVQILKNNIKTRFIRALAHSSHTKLSYGSFSTLGTRAPNQPYKTRSLIYYFFIYYFFLSTYTLIYYLSNSPSHLLSVTTPWLKLLTSLRTQLALSQLSCFKKFTGSLLFVIIAGGSIKIGYSEFFVIQEISFSFCRVTISLHTYLSKERHIQMSII